MSTTKVLPKSSSPKPKKCCSNSRCPVDDTGRNSVKPSTTPSTMALIRSNSMRPPRHGARFAPGVFRAGPVKGQPKRSQLLVEHDLVRKPVPTFRDHALRGVLSSVDIGKEESAR